MNLNQSTKLSIIKVPSAIALGTSPATTSVDTKGWSHAVVTFLLGATDVGITVLKLQESDDDSVYTDITGADFSTSLPAATDDNNAWRFFVNLSGRKRYLDLVYTIESGDPEILTGAYTAAWCELFGSDDSVNDAMHRGVCGEVLV